MFHKTYFALSLRHNDLVVPTDVVNGFLLFLVLSFSNRLLSYPLIFCHTTVRNFDFSPNVERIKVHKQHEIYLKYT